ncbi:MAG: DUF5916 domain-containing protein [Candidatus Poribacteria bacterium]
MKRFRLYLILVLLISLFLMSSPIFGLGKSEDKTQNLFIRRVVRAHRLSKPPKIDADLSDSVWQEAAMGETFVDQVTNQPVGAQTRFWLGYDDTAIYFAAYCEYAQPEVLIARATKRDTSLWDDDFVEFQIDAYHTHRFEDFSRFAVNPINTQFSRMGGGRSGKTEWQGDWQAASRVVSDGWVAEMRIPWAILNFPNTDAPTTLGFNVIRGHAQLKIRSWFSNIGQKWLNEWAADWVGVELPTQQFRQELLVLPFTALGTTQDDADEWQQTIRAGLDVRYRPTPSLTGVLTLNPDFRNVQSVVEGIDFTRGERWVDESRPFFQEGERIFQTSSGIGSYFYSRRIPNIDLGMKVYGKLARQTNVGLLSTFDLDDQHDELTNIFRQDHLMSFTQNAGDWGSFSVTGVHKRDGNERNSVIGYRARIRYGTQWHTNFKYGSSAWTDLGSKAHEFKRGDLGSFSVGWGNGRFRQGADYFFLSPQFQASDGFFNFVGRRGVIIKGGYENEWRERSIRDAGFAYFANYEERYHTGSGFDSIDTLLSNIVDNRETNAQFFRDNFGYDARMTTRSDYGISQSFSIGRFREEDSNTADLDWSLGIWFGARVSDQDRNFGFRYSFGRADEKFRHFISPGIHWKWLKLSADWQGSALRHAQRRQQHIITLNYDFTSTMTLGGRFVFERDELANDNSYNAYLSFRRSGEAGMEIFLIFGEPGADTFTPGFEGKMLFPL